MTRPITHKQWRRRFTPKASPLQPLNLRHWCAHPSNLTARGNSRWCFLLRVRRMDRSSSYGPTSLIEDTLGGVSFWPNVRKPVTDSKLDAQLFADAGATVVMFMFIHRGRHMQHISSLPVLITSLDFAITLSLQNVDHSFEMLMPSAVMVRRVLEDECHGHTGSFEAVGRHHQVASRVMLLLDCGKVP